MYTNEFLGFSQFACGSVTLTGTVTGASGPVAGIVIQYQVNCRTFDTLTNASGLYTITVPRGTCVRITLGAIVGVTPTPAERVVCPACNDQSGLDFTITPITPGNFTVSGTVSGLTNNVGVTVNYAINGVVSSTVTGAGGVYTISAPSGASVVIIPSAQSGFTVAPTNYQLANLSANVTGQNFVYTALTTNFTVSGTLSNIQGVLPNQTVQYIVNGQSATTTTNASGQYSFTAPSGASIVIIPPQINNFTNQPPNIIINNLSAHTPNQNFFYNVVSGNVLISGLVSGLSSNVGIPVIATINGQASVVSTNTLGIYNIIAPMGANVTVLPTPQAGFSVSPFNYVLNNVQTNTFNQNFAYSATV